MQNTVQEFLDSDILKVTENISIQFAVSLVLYRQADRVYVVDEQQHLLGLVPGFSLVKSLINAENKSHTVGQIMSSHIVSCDACSEMAEVAPLFREACHESIAVTDRGILVGQLLRHDVLRWLSLRSLQGKGNDGSEKRKQIPTPQFLKKQRCPETTGSF